MMTMPSDELDLERGKPDDPTSERRRRRREQRQASSAGNAERDKPKPVSDSELRNQLSRAFDGLVKNREKRGDKELATAFQEEADAMTEGFVTLTEFFKPFRLPLIIILNLIITVLAFGRVGGILIGRWQTRRERRAAEQAAAEQEGAFPIEEQ